MSVPLKQAIKVLESCHQRRVPYGFGVLVVGVALEQKGSHCAVRHAEHGSHRILLRLDFTNGVHEERQQRRVRVLVGRAEERREGAQGRGQPQIEVIRDVRYL